MSIYYPGYAEARKRVQEQTLEQDLATIDDLFGRDNLSYGDSPEKVKEEALRQLEIEFTDNSPEAKARREWADAVVESMKFQKRYGVSQ